MKLPTIEINMTFNQFVISFLFVLMLAIMAFKSFIWLKAVYLIAIA